MGVNGHGELTFQVEVFHTFPATITFDIDNINGCAWDAEDDPLFLTECQVAVTAPRRVGRLRPHRAQQPAQLSAAAPRRLGRQAASAWHLPLPIRHPPRRPHDEFGWTWLRRAADTGCYPAGKGVLKPCSK
jgi:hypothetical protein